MNVVMKDTTLYKDGSKYKKKLQPVSGLGFLPRPNFLENTTRNTFSSVIGRYFPGKLDNSPTVSSDTDKTFLSKDITKNFSGCIGPLDILTEIYGGESAFIDNMDVLQFMTDLFTAKDSSKSPPNNKALPLVNGVYCPGPEGLYHNQDYTNNTIYGFMMEHGNKTTSSVLNGYQLPSMIYQDYNLGSINATKGNTAISIQWSGTDITLTLAGKAQTPLRYGNTSKDFVGGIGIVMLGANDEYLSSWLLCKPYLNSNFTNGSTTTKAADMIKAINTIETNYHGNERVFGMPALWNSGSNQFNTLLNSSSYTVKYHKNYSGEAYARLIYCRYR